MLVAKSYTDLKRLSEPFQENGKWYVNIELKSGKPKKVRAYSEAEYAKMYGGGAPSSDIQARHSAEYVPTPDDLKYGGQKHALGFDKDYITIFKGDQDLHQDWFRCSNARYCRLWGWYVVSREQVPADLPYGIEPVRLDWELVAANAYNIKGEDEVRKVVEPLIYGESPSNYQGSIGERIPVKATVVKAIEIEGNYPATLYVLEDPNKNQYIWQTSAKKWDVGFSTSLVGTVKEHRMFHGVKQTVLTRCLQKGN